MLLKLQRPFFSTSPIAESAFLTQGYAHYISYTVPSTCSDTYLYFSGFANIIACLHGENTRGKYEVIFQTLLTHFYTKSTQYSVASTIA